VLNANDGNSLPVQKFPKMAADETIDAGNQRFPHGLGS